MMAIFLKTPYQLVTDTEAFMSKMTRGLGFILK